MLLELEGYDQMPIGMKAEDERSSHSHIDLLIQTDNITHAKPFSFHNAGDKHATLVTEITMVTGERVYVEGSVNDFQNLIRSRAF